MSNQRFTAIAFNPMSGDRIGELGYASFNYDHGLAGTGTGSMEVPWTDAVAPLLVPWTCGIAFDDGGQCRWSGLLDTVEVDPASPTVKLGLISWWEYYEKRWIRSTAGMSHAETVDVGPYDVVFLDVDQFDIVDDLLAHAQSVAGVANVPLVVNMLGPGGGGVSEVLRTRTYYGYERKTIKSAVEDLSSQRGGFDFTVRSVWNTSTDLWTVDRYLDLHYPRRGEARSSTVLEHGANATMLRLVTTGSGLQNPVWAVGAGVGDAAIVVEATDASQRYPIGPYPYAEGSVEYRDEGAEFSGNLERLALGALAVGRAALPTATVGLTEQPNGSRLGDIGVGDTVRTVAQFGEYQIDEWLRVVKESVAVTSGGLQKWQLDLADETASLGGS